MTGVEQMTATVDPAATQMARYATFRDMILQLDEI
ncbi:hypothetical protein HD593_005562 [Nonomuraea rubra]|uniref:Uncharacterized protein n=1 Tax=Nonomuraea rubra TaxID=46180 RepID=A0A7X0NW55_9ACTN|nr:hypothetical protein [Nonomuraea rubra]